MIDIRNYILTEAVHNFRDDSRIIFDKLGLREITNFLRTRKVPMWFKYWRGQEVINVIDSKILRSPTGQKFNKLLPIPIQLKQDDRDVTGGASGWYDSRKRALVIVIPDYIMALFENTVALAEKERYSRGYMDVIEYRRRVDWGYNRLKRDWSEMSILTTIDHELNHWGDDAMHTGTVYPFKQRKIPWGRRPHEIDAVVSQFQQKYNNTARSAWDRLTFDQAIKLVIRGSNDHYDPPDPIFDLMAARSGSSRPHNKARDRLLKALHKQGILGRSMR